MVHRPGGWRTDFASAKVIHLMRVLNPKSLMGVEASMAHTTAAAASTRSGVSQRAIASTGGRHVTHATHFAGKASASPRTSRPTNHIC